MQMMPLILCLFLIVVGLFGVFMSGRDEGMDELRKEAKEKGYMQYVVDQTDGKSKLEWK